MDILKQDIQYLSGVGPSRKKILGEELGIFTYGDLLNNFPYKYVDRSKVYTIHELTGDMPFVQIVGKILSFETFEMGPRKERRVVPRWQICETDLQDWCGICSLWQAYSLQQPHQRHPPRHGQGRHVGAFEHGHATLLLHNGEDEETGADIAHP